MVNESNKIGEFDARIRELKTLIREEQKYQEIIDIQKKQTILSEEQTRFNELLTIATIVLAFGFILTFFKIEILWGDNIFLIMILVFVTLYFFVFILILVYKSISLINKMQFIK